VALIDGGNVIIGYFVLKNGEREEEFRIKMETNEDGTVTDVYVEGDIEEIERMQTELGLTQKGKVKVKGWCCEWVNEIEEQICQKIDNRRTDFS